MVFHDTDSMFQADKSTVSSRIEELSVFCAQEDQRIAQLESELKDLKKVRDQAKEQLARMLVQSGLESVKLANGLIPKAVVKERLFKAAGISDEQVFNWLKVNDLAGIIKPSVHFKTLDTALKEHRDNGGQIPSELFNVSQQLTVTLYNKSKFLAARQSQMPQPYRRK